MPKVTFIKNAKVNSRRFKINDSLEVDKKEYDELLEAEVITTVDEAEFEGPNQDLSSLSIEELQKIKNDDMKVFLDSKEIQYESKATKDELIALIIGEEPKE